MPPSVRDRPGSCEFRPRAVSPAHSSATSRAARCGLVRYTVVAVVPATIWGERLSPTAGTDGEAALARDVLRQ